MAYKHNETNAMPNKRKPEADLAIPGNGLLQKALRAKGRNKSLLQEANPGKFDTSQSRTVAESTPDTPTTAKNPPGIKRKTEAEGRAELEALRNKRKKKNTP